MNAANLLAGFRIVPVVAIDDAGAARPLAETLLEAGLAAIEVTLRTPAAIDAIETIAAKVPGMLVGAGSIRDREQVPRVDAAGAKFAVSPGSNAELLDAVTRHGLPFVPGAVTATEVLGLFAKGYTLQKFFPAELAGGVNYIKALGAPLPEISFMPTGGINAENAASYLALKNVACIGGTWIVPGDLLVNKDFAKIADLARNAAALAADS